MLAGKTVLIADDEPGILGMASMAFSAARATVFTANDGHPAIRMMEAQAVDLAIIDIIMPDKEGVETIMEIRKRWPACKIIAISGGGMIYAHDHLSLAKGVGADATMSKPFALSDLVQLSGRLLAFQVAA